MKTVFEEVKRAADHSLKGSSNSRLEIICCLLAHQDEPVRLEKIAESTGLPLETIERELDALEGPFDAARKGGGAYIHRARCSSQAVLIA